MAMGGSTNTVLHLLAAPHEAGVDFTMADIDRLSHDTPCLCNVAPNNSNVHIEDVHRAGGVISILGQLDRAGLLNTDCSTVHSRTLGDALNRWDLERSNAPPPPMCRTFTGRRPGACVPPRPSASRSAGASSIPTGASRHCFHRDPSPPLRSA
jgi:dihydroxy-acid dehydratase